MPEELNEPRLARDVMEHVILENPTLVADADTPLADILKYLARALYEQPELPGIAVRDGDQLEWMIPRQRLLALARDYIRNRPVELTGVSLDRARYFVCPKGDYEMLVIFYDPDDPPRCPTHKLPLNEED